MPIGRERVLSDDALDRLGRELIAEVRAQHPQKLLRKHGADPVTDIGVDLLDSSMGAGDDVGDGDSGD